MAAACLRAVRKHIADESVDLICLDPPFNSKKRDYNLLFKLPKWIASEPQIESFKGSFGRVRRQYPPLPLNSSEGIVAQPRASDYSVVQQCRTQA